MQKVAVIILILFLPIIASAQKDSLNSDQLFKQARELAFSNKWKAARSIARVVINQNSKYYDARILIGRTYAWESKFDSARIELSKVIQADSSNLDALSALIDVFYWSSEYEKALKVCNTALSFAPYDKDLLMKKVKILLALDREDEARAVLALLLKLDPYGHEINALLASLKKYKNRIAIEHTFDYFYIPYHQRWHVTSLQYERDSKKGAIIGKINIGQRIDAGETFLSNPEIQFEVDAYPIIRPGTYLYLNYGLAPGYFFPRIRMGFEFFQSLGNGWEASIGGRLFKLRTAPDVKILTGSISRYSKSNFISLRPYLIYGESYSEALYFQYRHFLSTSLNYIGGTVGYGNSPDNVNANAQLNFQYRNSGYHFRFEYQHKISTHFLFRLMPEYSFEEYRSRSYRSRFTGNIYVAYMF